MSYQDEANLVPWQVWLVIAAVLIILALAGMFLAYEAVETLITILGRRWWIIVVSIAPVLGLATFYAKYRDLSKKTAVAFIALAVAPGAAVAVGSYYSDPAAYYDIESVMDGQYLISEIQMYGDKEPFSMPTPRVQNVTWRTQKTDPVLAIQGSIWDAVTNALSGNLYPREGKANLAYWVQTPHGWVLANTGTARVRTDTTTRATSVFRIPDSPVVVVGITVYKARTNMYGQIPKSRGLDDGTYRFGEEVAYREIVVEEE